MKLFEIPEEMLGTCAWCGETFLQRRKDHKTCSANCRLLMHRHKQALKYHQKKKQKEDKAND